MADLAQLGIEIDSSKVKTATSDLKDFNSTAAASGKAADDFGKAASGSADKIGQSFTTNAQRVAAAAAQQAGAMGGAVHAADNLSNAHAGLTTQGMALMHAFRTASEELALGVPVTQVLTQQFSHLSYAASGPGGLTGAFGELKGLIGGATSAAAGFVTPVIAAAGAVGLLAAGGIAAAVSWQNGQREIETALQGDRSAVRCHGDRY